MFLVPNRGEEINYFEIAKLSHMEVREALHVFLGMKKFPSFYVVPPHETGYFRREKIWYFRKFNFLNDLDEVFKEEHPNYVGCSKEHLKQFEFWETLLLNYIDRLFTGVDPIGLDIKSARNINTQSPKSELRDQILYLWKTEHLLNWALAEGMILPLELQAVFNINQIERESHILKRCEVQKICIQALAQVLWYIDSQRSQDGIIRDMKKIIKNKSFNNGKFHEYRLFGSPLDFLISKERMIYFDNEKPNILLGLIKDVDPRPKNVKTGRPKPIKSQQLYPPKLIPEVFSQDKTDFQKLKIVIQTLGYYLYGFGEFTDVEGALSHPLISHYIGASERTLNLATYCLKYVCPTKQYVEIGMEIEHRLAHKFGCKATN